MTIRTDVIIAVVCAPRWDLAAQIVWRATVKRGAEPPFRDDAWFQRLVQMTDHSKSRHACASMAEKLHKHDDLVVCWSLLAIDPQDPVGLPDLLLTIGTAVDGLDFHDHPELLPRFAVMRDVARGKYVGEFGSLFHLASTHKNRKQQPSAASEAGDRAMTAEHHHALQTLLQNRWSDAFGMLFAPTEAFVGQARLQPLLDAAGDRKLTCEKIHALVETLYQTGTPATGDLALAWLMLTADPREPGSFLPVMPQLQFLLDNTELDERAEAELRPRIHSWWLAMEGAFIHSDVSIFRLADPDNLKTFRDSPADVDPDFEAAPDFGALHRNTPARPALPVGPTLVVMPEKLATRLNNFHAAFKPLVDKAMPLVVARDLVEIRNTLHAEYPHAQAAVDLVLRDLREGQPVTLKPMILVGSPGSGKSRLVRRLGELLKTFVYRFDAAASGDNHFAGTSKAWSNTEPSVPARAVAQSLTANPIVMVDEIDKAAERTNTGNLWHALTPFLERETSSRYRDQSLDAQMNISMLSFIATANDDSRLPAPLRDRFRVVRVPLPTAAHLPELAALVMKDLTTQDESRAYDDPLASDELDVIGRAWARAGFSLRKLQKIIQATLEARDQHAPRH
ncbi:MAG: AAA family ATPase [Pseudomonadota bacterium]